MDLSRRSALGLVAVSGVCIAAPVTAQAAFNGQAFQRPPFFRIARKAGRPNPRAEIAMKMICDTIGIERTIRLYSATITKPNVLAFATTIRGTRYIVYDGARVPWPETNIPWSSVLVMAHEVAHHAAGHNVRRDIPEKSEELESDRFSGFVLSKLNASLAQTLSFFSWDWPESAEHPSAATRREATRRGWELGERMKLREAPRIRRGR